MTKEEESTVKTAMEIGNLAAQLSPKDQAYVLNTINTLMFSRQTEQGGDSSGKPKKESV